MPVLVTWMFDEDPTKNEGAIKVTTVFQVLKGK